MNFTKDIVVITGGSNGIGKTLVQEYANKGAYVIIIDNDQGNGEKIIQDLNEYEERGAFFYCDLRKPESIHHTFLLIDQANLEPTILINNAGISYFKDFFELTVEDWDNVIQSNLRSAFLCSQELAKRWRNNGIHGRIINMASTRAFMSEQDSESYAASKGGMIALTHSMAISLSEYQIRVNSVSPGWIQTEHYEYLRDIDHTQHPSKRVGHPLDVARACFYLSDKENAFVTGENIVVDGGMTKKMMYEH
ncbi:SDR family oxidoreductase [Pontibacillus yanchengensis]|uniref:SDR family oxidoreductase n=2 Tax=Pontibacillus yanchengensis TaxID=462910 RepID=A0ACC7VDF8_9BACI|nr:SDR family oxidoreductase [Pontibacillus yanchengensis]MYL34768.1 SDR family oxidoreductase [Pontibacillus yanchengensis]MYL52246.1 SDR family oxidoreductase [Pontibacillus yanchengensis]